VSPSPSRSLSLLASFLPAAVPVGAYYLRLVGRAYDVYTYLEPLYNDFRRVRVALPDGRFALSHVDEVVDDMLRKDYLFDVSMPHIPYRWGQGREWGARLTGLRAGGGGGAVTGHWQLVCLFRGPCNGGGWWEVPHR
jgi:hypothetical protein